MLLVTRKGVHVASKSPYFRHVRASLWRRGPAYKTKSDDSRGVDDTDHCVGNPVLAEEPISRLYFELYDSSDTCAYIPNRPLFMLVLISG